MTHKRINVTDFNFQEFIEGIHRKYGYVVAKNAHDSMLKLKSVAQTNDYLDELNSPRFVARFKLYPLTGRLIVETINDQHKGYRYTVNHNKVIRKPVVY